MVPWTEIKDSGEAMVRNSIEDDVDELFRLPLSEFISARKTLGARLKKTGRADEAARVNALTKPPISAWTVNQLLESSRRIRHLITAGERFRKAEHRRRKSRGHARCLNARREALAELSDLASTLMSDAGLLTLEAFDGNHDTRAMPPPLHRWSNGR